MTEENKRIFTLHSSHDLNAKKETKKSNIDAKKKRPRKCQNEAKKSNFHAKKEAKCQIRGQKAAFCPIANPSQTKSLANKIANKIPNKIANQKSPAR